MNSKTLEILKAGSIAWQNAFNSKNAKGCADQYAEGSAMVAKPFGEFVGREAIEAFWQSIIDQGFSDVEYSNVEWHAEDEGIYTLTAKWTMNKAFGVIHKERWQIQEDGKALLIYDEFEVMGER